MKGQELKEQGTDRDDGGQADRGDNGKDENGGHGWDVGAEGSQSGQNSGWDGREGAVCLSFVTEASQYRQSQRREGRTNEAFHETDFRGTGQRPQNCSCLADSSAI